MPKLKVWRQPNGTWVGVTTVAGRPIYHRCSESDVAGEMVAAGSVFGDVKKAARKVARSRVIHALSKAAKTIINNPEIRMAISAVPGGGAALQSIDEAQRVARAASHAAKGHFREALRDAGPEMSSVLKAGEIATNASKLIERARKGEEDAIHGIHQLSTAAKNGSAEAERAMRVMKVVAGAHGEIRRANGSTANQVEPPENDGFINYGGSHGGGGFWSWLFGRSV